MKKHHFIIIAVLVCAGVMIAAQAVAETVELKFAHFMSPKHIQHQKSFDPFCKKVEELTGGAVKIKLYPGGALGGPKQLPDAVKAGIADIAFTIPAYTTGRFPRLSVMDLPFTCNSAVHSTKVVYALWDKYFSKDFADYKVLWMYSCSPGQFMSVDKPMKTKADIAGLKMRAPSAYMSKLFKALGANPIGMPISKLTVSLQKKVIDGMLTPYSAVKDFRLFDLVGHITEVNAYVMPMAVLMNKEKWNALSDDAKKVIDQAGGEKWGLHAARVYDDHDTNTIAEMKKLGKTKLFVMPEGEIEKIKEAVKPLTDQWLADMKKKGLPANAMLEDMYKAIEQTK